MDTIGRKKVEEELRESQKRFQGLVETLNDWVWEVDTQGRYTYVSPQVRNILGYHPDELLGKTPYDLMSPAEAARVAEVFTALIKDRSRSMAWKISIFTRTAGWLSWKPTAFHSSMATGA